MNKLLRKKNQGFTLIELMIVVVIIGILAATAIPAFLRFVRRSKTAETGVQLKALFEGAQAYYNRDFVPQGWTSSITSASACVIGVADTGLTPSDQKQIWDGTSGTNAVGLTGTGGSFGLGWGPADPLYYRYEIRSTVAATASCSNDTAGALMTFVALGDLDGDGTSSTFEMAAGVIPEGGLSHAPLFVNSELE